jgi:murein endopeptidase
LTALLVAGGCVTAFVAASFSRTETCSPEAACPGPNAASSTVDDARVSSPPVNDEELRLSKIARPTPVAVRRFDDDAFRVALREDPNTLGAIALGRPNRGTLFNGAQLAKDDERWKLEVPDHSFGTEETVRGIEAAIVEVNRLFPNTPTLSIGHLSSEKGGWLRPHRSHQNGRDVDLGFYYTDGSPWYRRATPENLDIPRTWALLSSLERAAGLEYAFVDQSLHAALRSHAQAIGESEEFLQHMFDGPLPIRGPTIRHERGHLTHLHVRFASPIAVENASRARAVLGKGANSSTALAQLAQQRKRRFVAEQGVAKRRSLPAGSASARGSAGSRSKARYRGTRRGEG